MAVWLCSYSVASTSEYDALEALLGKGEVGQLVVQAFEQRAQRRLGLGPAHAAQARGGGRAGVERPARTPGLRADRLRLSRGALRAPVLRGRGHAVRAESEGHDPGAGARAGDARRAGRVGRRPVPGSRRPAPILRTRPSGAIRPPDRGRVRCRAQRPAGAGARRGAGRARSRLAEAPRALRRLLHGMRLFASPEGWPLRRRWRWRRTGDGRWQPFELEGTGGARGAPWSLVEDEEGGLAQFLEAVAAPPHTGRWPGRCRASRNGRRPPPEAPRLPCWHCARCSPSTRATPAWRCAWAVLCAEESERPHGGRGGWRNKATERFVIGDGADEPTKTLDAGRGGRAPPARAAARLLCSVATWSPLGHVADELLLDQPEPFEIRAASLKPAQPSPNPSSRASWPSTTPEGPRLRTALGSPVGRRPH